jgi:hypothetical protein
MDQGVRALECEISEDQGFLEFKGSDPLIRVFNDYDPNLFPIPYVDLSQDR